MSEKTKQAMCSFCYTPESKTVKLIHGASAAICQGCIKQADGEIQEAMAADEEFADMAPSALVRMLDQYLIGQERAKKILSVAIWNHFKRSFGTFRTPVQKSNVWLVGPSGSGKTAMVQLLADHLDIPFVSIDASTITESGYVGEDPEVVIARLFVAAEGNLEATQKGIVFIDEIDKLAKSASHVGQRDIKGAGVQQSLLKIIEGTTVAINPSGKKKNAQEPIEHVDTKDILFILGGAFVGIHEEMVKRPIGMESKAPGESRPIEMQDLLKYGMIPEIIGRVPILAETQALTRDSLIRILTEPKDSLTAQYQQLLIIDGIKLMFDKSFLEAVADKAIRLKTGARGLRSIMESSLLELMYAAPDRIEVGKRFPPLQEIILSAKDCK